MSDQDRADLAADLRILDRYLAGHIADLTEAAALLRPLLTSPNMGEEQPLAMPLPGTNREGSLPSPPPPVTIRVTGRDEPAASHTEKERIA